MGFFKNTLYKVWQVQVLKNKQINDVERKKYRKINGIKYQLSDDEIVTTFLQWLMHDMPGVEINPWIIANNFEESKSLDKTREEKEKIEKLGLSDLGKQ